MLCSRPALCQTCMNFEEGRAQPSWFFFTATKECSTITEKTNKNILILTDAHVKIEQQGPTGIHKFDSSAHDF